jgi:uncharacterized protein (DUF2062 family)
VSRSEDSRLSRAWDRLVSAETAVGLFLAMILYLGLRPLVSEGLAYVIALVTGVVLTVVLIRYDEAFPF